MDWFYNMIKNYPQVGLIPAAGMGVFGFFGNLVVALSDGELDSTELHNLISGASGLETLLVLVVLLALRVKNRTK